MSDGKEGTSSWTTLSRAITQLREREREREVVCVCVCVIKKIKNQGTHKSKSSTFSGLKVSFNFLLDEEGLETDDGCVSVIV